MTIIAGSNNYKLATRLSSALGAKLIIPTLSKFPDQEFELQINDEIPNDSTIIVQSTHTPVNDSLMELLLISNILKMRGISDVTAVIPYFGYSRQDKYLKNLSFAYKLVVDVLAFNGIKRIITLDIHSSNIKKFDNISVKNLETTHLFANKIKNKQYNVISPDSGGIQRAQKLATLLGTNLIAIHKNLRSSKLIENFIIGNPRIINNSNCIIVDDIISTGTTILNCIELLKKCGVSYIESCITHGVFGSNISVINKLNSMGLEFMYLTNSITIPKPLTNYISIIDITNLIAHNI